MSIKNLGDTNNPETWKGKDGKRGNFFYVPTKVLNTVKEKIYAYAENGNVDVAQDLYDSLTEIEKHAILRHVINQNIKLIVNTFIRDVGLALLRKAFEDDGFNNEGKDQELTEAFKEVMNYLHEQMQNENPDYKGEFGLITDEEIYNYIQERRQEILKLPTTHDIAMGKGAVIAISFPEGARDILDNLMTQENLENFNDLIKRIINIKYNSMVAEKLNLLGIMQLENLDNINSSIAYSVFPDTNSIVFTMYVNVSNKTFELDEDKMLEIAYDTGFDLDALDMAEPTTRNLFNLVKQLPEIAKSIGVSTMPILQVSVPPFENDGSEFYDQVVSLLENTDFSIFEDALQNINIKDKLDNHPENDLDDNDLGDLSAFDGWFSGNE